MTYVVSENLYPQIMKWKARWRMWTIASYQWWSFPLSLEVKLLQGLITEYGVILIICRLNKPYSNHWYCDKTSDWFTLFFPSKTQLFPLIWNCWLENMAIRYKFDNIVSHWFLSFNESDSLYYNFPGVSTESLDYGGLDVNKFSQYCINHICRVLFTLMMRNKFQFGITS